MFIGMNVLQVHFFCCLLWLTHDVAAAAALGARSAGTVAPLLFQSLN
jgi:hypothetical protein